MNTKLNNLSSSNLSHSTYFILLKSWSLIVFSQNCNCLARYRSIYSIRSFLKFVFDSISLLVFGQIGLIQILNKKRGFLLFKITKLNYPWVFCLQSCWIRFPVWITIRKPVSYNKNIIFVWCVPNGMSRRAGHNSICGYGEHWVFIKWLLSRESPWTINNGLSLKIRFHYLIVCLEKKIAPKFRWILFK
jgi:hypothetical protein